MIFFACVLVCLVCGVIRARFHLATLHWGRAIAGLDYIEQEIQEAKASRNSARAIELTVDGINQRGFQDAITPPFLTGFTLTYWFVCASLFVWGFWVLPWYFALTWPLAYFVLGRLFQRLLPAPDSNFFRERFISSLTRRRQRYEQAGDHVRADAAEYMLMLLQEHEK